MLVAELFFESSGGDVTERVGEVEDVRMRCWLGRGEEADGLSEAAWAGSVSERRARAVE
jgi:hypothetical protein